jgi:hypothetical protein
VVAVGAGQGTGHRRVLLRARRVGRADLPPAGRGAHAKPAAGAFGRGQGPAWGGHVMRVCYVPGGRGGVRGMERENNRIQNEHATLFYCIWVEEHFVAAGGCPPARFRRARTKVGIFCSSGRLWPPRPEPNSPTLETKNKSIIHHTVPGIYPLQSSRASPSSSVFAGQSPVYSLERVLSETRLLWSEWQWVEVITLINLSYQSTGY